MAIHLIGGYQTDFARAWSREGLDYTDMMREGIDGALASCLLEPDDIEAIHVGNAFGELQRQLAWRHASALAFRWLLESNATRDHSRQRLGIDLEAAGIEFIGTPEEGPGIRIHRN